MKTSLTNTLDKKDIDEANQSFVAGYFFRKLLIDHLNKKIEIGREDTVKKDKYNLASWPYLQADSVGYERALREVISLLSDDEKKIIKK